MSEVGVKFWDAHSSEPEVETVVHGGDPQIVIKFFRSGEPLPNIGIKTTGFDDRQELSMMLRFISNILKQGAVKEYDNE